MKSLINIIDFLQQLSLDVELALNVDLRRDIEYIAGRLNDEGETFVYKTLPLLGDALLDGIETGTLKVPTNFRTYRQTAIPELFRSLFSRVFNSDGKCLDEAADAGVVRAIRQLTQLFKKVNYDFSKEEIQTAIGRYRTNEADMEIQNYFLDPNHFSCNSSWFNQIVVRASKIARKLLGPVPDAETLFPRHGPGSVATGEKGHKKWSFKRCLTLDERWLFDSSFFHIGKPFSPWKIHEKDSEPIPSIARIVFVPKEFGKPRVISMEPLEKQYLQQALRVHLQEVLYKNSRGRINFESTATNQLLACQSSKHRHWATIDFSDASDRISKLLVHRLVGNQWFRVLYGVSSHSAQLPDGTIVELQKFAPMGNALCFPIESLVFYSMTKAMLDWLHDNDYWINKNSDSTVQPITNQPPWKRWEEGYPIDRLTTGEPIKVHNQAFVYGDDVIIPADKAHDIMGLYQAFGIVASEKKSYVRSHFRESCGGDFYNGSDVSIVRFRTIGSFSDVSAADIFSSISGTRNEFHRLGYWKSAQWLDEWMQRRVPYPRSVRPTKGLSANCFAKPNESDLIRLKYDRNLQAHRAYSVFVDTKNYRMSGYPGQLLRSLLRSYSTAKGSKHFDVRGTSLNSHWSIVSS